MIFVSSKHYSSFKACNHLFSLIIFIVLYLPTTSFSDDFGDEEDDAVNELPKISLKKIGIISLLGKKIALAIDGVHIPLLDTEIALSIYGTHKSFHPVPNWHIDQFSTQTIKQVIDKHYNIESLPLEAPAAIRTALIKELRHSNDGEEIELEGKNNKLKSLINGDNIDYLLVIVPIPITVIPSRQLPKPQGYGIYYLLDEAQDGSPYLKFIHARAVLINSKSNKVIKTSPVIQRGRFILKANKLSAEEQANIKRDTDEKYDEYTDNFNEILESKLNPPHHTLSGFSKINAEQLQSVEEEMKLSLAATLNHSIKNILDQIIVKNQKKNLVTKRKMSSEIKEAVSVTIYYPAGISGAGPTLSVNGEHWGTLYQNSYITKKLRPGFHLVNMKSIGGFFWINGIGYGEVEYDLFLEIQDTQNSFFRFEGLLINISKDKAQLELADLKTPSETEKMWDDWHEEDDE